MVGVLVDRSTRSLHVSCQMGVVGLL
jgi:hypothetical protein